VGTSGKRRYQIFLKSEGGTPIDVYLVSQEPEQYQPEDELDAELQIQPVQPTTPSKKGSLSPDPSVDTTGLLKLGSPVQVDPDYYLNNMYQSEGISDFYTPYDDILSFCQSIVCLLLYILLLL
jgi:hypothetical protein